MNIEEQLRLAQDALQYIDGVLDNKPLDDAGRKEFEAVRAETVADIDRLTQEVEALEANN